MAGDWIKVENTTPDKPEVWILAELLGRKPRINPLGFRNDVAMLRYDESVFVSNASKRCRLE